MKIDPWPMRAVVVLMLLATPACAVREQAACDPVAEDLRRLDRFTLAGERDLVRDVEPRNADGTVNVVIEIPAGTVDKWEVDKSDGTLRWERVEGAPRVVRFLGYPGNYGMVPRSLLPAATGGDGDPLDVLVLGPAVARGEVLPVRLLGVLKMRDDGETDDKLIAAAADGPLASARGIADLDERFPGVTGIVESWFAHYKGPGRVETDGFRGPQAAERLLDSALAAYREAGAAAGM